MNNEAIHRERLARAKRIVVKVGSRVLVGPSGKPSSEKIERIVKQVCALRKRGVEVVIVSSGAIAAGVDALGFKQRPVEIPDLQMAASVGQPKLLAIYSNHFNKRRLSISQVLLTHDDLTNRSRHLNARNAMLRSLQCGVVPIVNENDTTAVDEIQVGDNDVLAAMVAVLIDADALLLLSTTNGLRRPSAKSSSRISFLAAVTDAERRLVSPKHDKLSTGGMATKLEAAATASKAGILSVIADGRKKGTIQEALTGRSVGTLIGLAQSRRSDVQRARKRWIAFFHRADGTINIDEGAAKALARRNSSLLPVGVKSIDGSFARGALVNIQSPEGVLIARGLVSYSSQDLAEIIGKRSAAIKKRYGLHAAYEVVHRDNLVVLED